MGGERLSERVCVVTGAGSGIGAAVARRFADEGATVVGLDLRSGEVEAVVRALPGAHHAIAADVSDEEAVGRAFAESAARTGRSPAVLVNVAGIGSTTNAQDTTVEVWDRVMAVNARGTFLCCKHAIPAMAAAGGGSIVNVASVAGMIGLRNRVAYSASKGAVIALTRALAVDHVGDGVRVNCICPGTVDSPWVRRLVEEAGEGLDALRARQPMGRLGQPEEIAEAALYLAADSGAFATGSVLVVDGGLTAA